MISCLEPVPGAEPAPPPDYVKTIMEMTGGIWDGRPQQFRSPPIADILQWRLRVNAKYHDQFGEDLDWDETSAFERSEDTATSADMLLRYVAAVLDQRGPDEARALSGSARPSRDVLNAAFEEADRRGFAGRFPQLMLGATCWLPFQRHLIIEEPNWQGSVARFGSLYRLADEVEQGRGFIALAEPGATAWTATNYTEPPTVLAAAWQASDTISRLGKNAIDQRLPLWTTG